VAEAAQGRQLRVQQALAPELRRRRRPVRGHRAAREGRAVDVQDVLEHFAFDNICRVAFDRLSSMNDTG
jgi:hypothetical protein